jgi:mRNA interferase MazF
MVVSPRDYNRLSSLILVCPISRNLREWPFKVAIPPIGRLTGSVVVDQIRAIDPEVRAFLSFGRVPESVLLEVRGHLASMLALPEA